jgi:hypothetical protein
LLLTLSAGRIAFGATRSVSVMDVSKIGNDGAELQGGVEGGGP